MTYEPEDVVTFANVAMAATVEALVKRGKLSPEDATAFMATHAFVARKKVWTDYLSKSLRDLIGATPRSPRGGPSAPAGSRR